METELETCNEKPTEIARDESPSRGQSLIFSGMVTMFVLGAHAYFTFHGKTYEIPDVAWTIILAPWLGVGAGKLAKIAKMFKRK